MNLRRKRPHDSLYMLLDTMCNAFGGIILLAVLVTLLTSREIGARSEASESPQLLERRIALAQTNLAQSAALSASLEARAKDNRWKDQIALLATRDELRAAVARTRATNSQNSTELDNPAAVDPKERAKDLNAKMAAAQQHKLDQQNHLQIATEDRQHARQRLDAVQRQIDEVLASTQRPLRLPLEHQTGKGPCFIILEYGRFYPVRNADQSRNETTINWTLGGDREVAKPIKSKGFDVLGGDAEMRFFFNSLEKDKVYVIFAVFEDSFAQFNQAKQVAAACGLSYGWEPFRSSDGPVTFTMFGHTPKPE
jgi:hypothetical protein